MSSHDHMQGHHAPDYNPGHDELSGQMSALLDSAEQSAVTAMQTLQYSPARAMAVFLRIAKGLNEVN